jgi:Phosphatidylinositol 3- and 4-kinase
MVFILAALYSYYKSRENAEDQDEGTTGANTTGEDTSPEQRRRRRRQEVTEQIKRSGSALYQEAVLRCHPAGATNNMPGDDFEAETSTPLSMKSSSSSEERPPQHLPLDSVKQEWIDACFGNDFLLPHCPVSGEGVSGTYQTATVSIPAGSRCTTNNKVGVTVAKLAVGLYVKSVVPGSEAAVVGIQPESVLLAVNDLPVLAEPSKQLLERLWQYEGYFLEKDDSADPNRSTQPQTVSNSEADAVICEPVALKFVYRRQIYTVIMLSNPVWGIQWAPAAPNMPLVKRVYSFAADAELRKGSLVAAVNGRTFRDMDHVQTAIHIRDLFENGQAVRLTTAFPPVTARASHYERLLTGERRVGQTKKEAQKQRKAGQYDGVEVKFLPLGYAIGSLCASEKNVFYEESSVTEQSTEDLAEAVVAGRMEPPLPTRRRRVAPMLQKYAPCPSLRTEQLLEEWDSLQSLVYCLRFQRCSSDETDFLEQLNGGIPQKSPVETLHELTSGLAGADIASAFLLQFISLICAPGQCGDESTGKLKGEGVVKKNANELTSMLLKLSRKNEAFCQRLYFLLRSYISTFETSRPQQDGESRNLTALLNCLELLRFAEKELAGRLPFKKSHSASSSSPQLSGRDITFGRVGSTLLESSIRGIDPSPAPTPIPASPESPASGGTDIGSPKKKGVLNFLGKSPVRRWRSAQSSETRSPRRPVQDARRSSSSLNKEPELSSLSLVQSPSTMYENMSDFLTELDKICATIERSLQKSFRQKIADWALQPWSAGKDAALAEVTAEMRSSLENAASRPMLLVNPVESAELLSSVDYNECYILPSAHFPILLTFNVSERRCSDSIVGEERLYRTKVELVSLKSTSPCEHHSFSVQGAVAGTISESGESLSVSRSATNHTWRSGGFLVFETRSSWGAPQTLSLRLSGQSDNFDKRGNFNSEVGFCWLDLSEQWKHGEVSEYSSTKKITTDVWPINAAACQFDDHGDLPEEAVGRIGRMQLEVRVTTESVEFVDVSNGDQSRKRMLLYKHDDDLRQEAFAIQFIKTCGDILKVSGLDMKLLTFQCIPVGARRGFVEWVPGSVPLSEICHPFSSILPSKSPADGRESPPMLSKAGLSKYESLRRLGGQQNESLRRLATGTKAGARGSIANDPIQDYLRSVAFDAGAPYLIRRDVMETYVKSCAGYSVITYILGVGDRHLDNLLLHQSGSFFHCDFSFILGSDPKTFLPMRITEDMVYGMGGKESDNYARFLSLIGAAFLALRRPENVRVLLSMVRLMQASCLPDISENQTVEQAILGVRDRLRLDLSDSRAITYMEDLVEASLSNKMWIAVDAMHHLGKTF